MPASRVCLCPQMYPGHLRLSLVFLCAMTRLKVRDFRSSSLTSLSQTWLDLPGGLLQLTGALWIAAAETRLWSSHSEQWSTWPKSHRLRLGLHWYKSRYQCTGFRKHEFACIPIAAVHNNTGSHTSTSYHEIRAVFVYSSSFLSWILQKQTPESFVTSVITSLLWCM